MSSVFSILFWLEQILFIHGVSLHPSRLFFTYIQHLTAFCFLLVRMLFFTSCCIVVVTLYSSAVCFFLSLSISVYSVCAAVYCLYTQKCRDIPLLERIEEKTFVKIFSILDDILCVSICVPFSAWLLFCCVHQDSMRLCIYASDKHIVRVNIYANVMQKRVVSR